MNTYVAMICLFCASVAWGYFSSHTGLAWYIGPMGGLLMGVIFVRMMHIV